MAVSQEEATAELSAVVASPSFVRSPRLARLLTYLCTKYLSGEADQIKEYSIGVEVLERPANFDPASDAGARVEVHRLRRRLQKYYEAEGAARKLRIVIPVGHYVPSFVPNTPEPGGTSPEVGEIGEPAADPPYGLVADILVREPAPRKRSFPPLWLVITGITALAALSALALYPRKQPPSGTVPGRDADASAPFPLSVRPSPGISVPSGGSIRLACGRGVSYTDRSGRTWSADRYFQGGTAFDLPRQYVARAIDPRLFQNGRTGDFSYHIPLPKGVYELRLGFVETSFGPSTPSGGGEYSRTFDVKANGRTLLDDFDIYSDANGSNVADTRVFKDISPGQDGTLHLEFHGRRAPALINTIELEPEPGHRLNPIRIVAQDNFLTLANGTVWSPDAYVIGGQLATHSVTVEGEDPDLYTHERYGHFEYAIPVGSGTYGLTLYFAEEYFGSGGAGSGGQGSRVFDVFCNGVALLRNFDILKETGMNHPLVKTFHGLAPNAQGKLVISFIPIHNYASLYALEVVDESQ